MNSASFLPSCARACVRAQFLKRFKLISRFGVMQVFYLFATTTTTTTVTAEFVSNTTSGLNHNQIIAEEFIPQTRARARLEFVNRCAGAGVKRACCAYFFAQSGKSLSACDNKVHSFADLTLALRVRARTSNCDAILYHINGARARKNALHGCKRHLFRIGCNQHTNFLARIPSFLRAQVEPSTVIQPSPHVCRGARLTRI